MSALPDPEHSQAAIQASQKTQDIATILRLYEAPGDVFFHGVQRRETTTYFYKDAKDAATYFLLAAAIGINNEELQLVLSKKLMDIYGKFLLADIFRKLVVQLSMTST